MKCIIYNFKFKTSEHKKTWRFGRKNVKVFGKHIELDLRQNNYDLVKKDTYSYFKALLL